MSLSGIAYADEYDVSGQDCVPISSTVVANQFTNSLSPDAWLGWRTSPDSGTISLICGIPYLYSPTHIELYFQNSTSCTGCASDYVEALYVKMDRSSGARTVVGSISSASIANTGMYQGISSSFTDTWNAAAYIYYVEIDLFRGSSSNNSAQEWFLSVVY